MSRFEKYMYLVLFLLGMCLVPVLYFRIPWLALIVFGLMTLALVVGIIVAFSRVEMLL
jgi:hypothetical protein